MSTIHAYTALQPDELSLQAGDVVKVLKKTTDGKICSTPHFFRGRNEIIVKVINSEAFIVKIAIRCGSKVEYLPFGNFSKLASRTTICKNCNYFARIF